jgi:uncharacterized repeat protein (TIGR04138 family)
MSRGQRPEEENTMSGIILDDRMLDRLREQYPQFHESAYTFVLASLHHVIQHLPEPRHISGAELAEGVRDLAVDRFGPMARTVLEHWGITSTRDVGAIVFALVEHGVLIREDDDVLEDFEDVFDFDQAFQQEYPWGRG